MKKINKTIYIPDHVREYWNDHGGLEMMMLWLTYAPYIMKYMRAKNELKIFLEDKPELKHLLEDIL